MAARTRTVLALVVAGVCFATASALAAMDLLTPAISGGGPIVPIEVVPVALFLWGTPLLGLIVAVRRPENPIGWLLMVTAFGWALGFAVDDLAHRGVGVAFSGPLAIAQAASALGFLGLILLLVYFPSGTLPSKRWRLLPLGALAGSTASAVAGLFTPGSIVDDPPVPELANPFGQPNWAHALEVLQGFGQIVFVLVVAGAVALLVSRVRRSRGTEHQQLKWFVSAGALCAALFLAALIVGTLAPDAVVGTVLWAAGLSSLFLIPLATALAILRYRLYEIDRIVSRTISYALVSATLGAAFWAAVLVLQSALASVTESDTLTVAGSTLLVAALFRPVRRRIQAAVDGRFNRRRYDAEQSLAAFAEQLRRDIDLESVGRGIDRIVSDTLAPVVVGLWIRPVAARSASDLGRPRNASRTREA